MLLLLTPQLSDFIQQASHLILKLLNRFIFQNTRAATNSLKLMFFEVNAPSGKFVSYVIASSPSLDKCYAPVLVFENLN